MERTRSSTGLSGRKSVVSGRGVMEGARNYSQNDYRYRTPRWARWLGWLDYCTSVIATRMRESAMPDNNDEAGEPKGDQQAPKRPAESGVVDPNDIIPVPVAMEPAELDERAQVVEELRARQDERGRDRDDGMGDEPTQRDESRRRR